MAEKDAPTQLPQAGEPGTIAVTIPEQTAVRPEPFKQRHKTDVVPKTACKNLSVSYIDRRGQVTEAVRDVSFDVLDNRILAKSSFFLGPSGCGKSTILKAVCGIIATHKR